MSHDRGGVVLLHGHGLIGSSMLPLARRLRREGYETLTPSYPFRRPVAQIVARLAPRIEAFSRTFAGPIHFVAHSLGGLVARALLAAGRAPRASRLVMLGPPNSGSEIADLLVRWRLDRVVLGRSAAHLRTVRLIDDESLLGEVAHEVGVIAGDRPLAPGLSLLLPKPNDGKVSVASTRLAGMTDHVVLPVSHLLMVYDRRVARQVSAFLATGRFERG